MEFKAVILCAGWGSRLRPLTHTMSKTLIPIANRPILAYQLEALARAGIDNVALIVNGSQADAFQEAVSTYAPSGMRVITIEQPSPRGLAHAVDCARQFIGSAPFIVLLGDNLFTWDLTPFVRRFEREKMSALIMSMRVHDPERFGIITVKGTRVLDLEEKPVAPRSNLAISGIYFLRPSIFRVIDRLQPSDRGELELTDALRGLVRNGERVEAMLAPSWCCDVGTFDSLLEANRVLLDELPSERADTAELIDSEIRGRVLLGEGCKLERTLLCGPVAVGAGATIRGSCVGPFTSIDRDVTVEGSVVEHSIILAGAHVKEITSGIRESLIGRNVVIKAAECLPTFNSIIVGDNGVLTLADPGRRIR